MAASTVCTTQAATQLPVTPPDSGSLLQQIKPVPSVTPSSDATGLIIETQRKSTLPAGAPFKVATIEIVGNTLFDTQTLHNLVADVEGQQQTLQQLSQAVERITDYYHKHHYLLARAYIPAQVMHDGIVRIAVVEAHYGQIQLINHSLVHDDVLRDTLSYLKGGAEIEQNRLDRILLLVSDIPGVTSTATLKPGETVGTADLIIDAQPTPVWNSNVLLDDYGNRFTGRERLGGTFNWTDPLHAGDMLSVYVLSTGKDMDNANLTYETLVSGQGTRVGGSISALHYTLGDSLTALDGHGTAQIGSAWLKFPWQRSPDVNVYTQLQYDYKKLDDDIDSTGIQTNRHMDSGTFSLNGDVRDDSLAGAITTWSLELKTGVLNFDNPAARIADASSARTQTRFLKWTGNYVRLQSISDTTALFAALSAQWSNTNLDSSEKMVAGGAYSVRAYDMGALSGDTGVLGNIELRQNLGDLGGTGQWQALAFIDSEHITINNTTWTSGTNTATLSGAGLGLNWNNSAWHSKFFVSKPIGSTPDLIDGNHKMRGWIEIGVWF